MNETKETIIRLLTSTKRKGINSLLDYLITEGFFESPASTRFHGSYKGGLANHNLGVYELVSEYAVKFKIDKKANYGQMPMTVTPENIIIACLLHDVCKIGAYKRTKADDGWTNNKDKDKGHAKLSIKRIKKHIELEKIEELMIKFHMGLYGTHEWGDSYCDEYPLVGDHSKDPKEMTKEQKIASQKARYGKSLRNAYYHNPVCFWMFVADMMQVAGEKAEG